MTVFVQLPNYSELKDYYTGMKNKLQHANKNICFEPKQLLYMLIFCLCKATLPSSVFFNSVALKVKKGKFINTIMSPKFQVQSQICHQNEVSHWQSKQNFHSSH